MPNNVAKLLVVGAVGVFLALSCGGRAGTGGSGGGTGGVGGADADADGACVYQHYFAPGCGASPRCTGAGGACLSFACGCSGTIIGGCQNEFAEPYAYKIPAGLDAGDVVGSTCDPNSDAGP